MLEWIVLAANGFWIVGLALLLAGFSYHYWLAQRDGRPLRQQLGTDAFRRLGWFGLVLVAIGLAGTSRAGWEAAIWSLVTLYGIARLVALYRGRPVVTRVMPTTDNQKDKTANSDDDKQDQVGLRAPDARTARPDSAS